METKFAAPRQSAGSGSWFCYTLAGWVLGMIGQIVIALVIASQTHVQAQADTAAGYELIAYAVPITAAIWAGLRAESNPYPWLGQWWVVALNLMLASIAGFVSLVIW